MSSEDWCKKSVAAPEPSVASLALSKLFSPGFSALVAIGLDGVSLTPAAPAIGLPGELSVLELRVGLVGGSDLDAVADGFHGFRAYRLCS